MVKNILTILFFLTSPFIFSQANMELSMTGFAPIEIVRPVKTNQNLIDLTRDWADRINKKEYDVYDVTESSVKVDGLRDNAFFYRNRGTTFFYRIRYTIGATFGEKTVTLTFKVKEIYAKNTLVETTILDYFSEKGEIKTDYEEVKTSLEATANNIVNSYASFIAD